MQTRILNVPDVSCGHCERVIKKALNGISGLASVEVDIPRKQVTVEYNESILDIKAIMAILEGEGYPIELKSSQIFQNEETASCCGSCHT
jgi:copper chaperone